MMLKKASIIAKDYQWHEQDFGPAMLERRLSRLLSQLYGVEEASSPTSHDQRAI